MAGSTHGSSAFAWFLPEVEFPAGSYKSSAFRAGSPGAVAVLAAWFVHPLSEVIDNFIDGGVRAGVVPCGGTVSKIVARRAGAPGVLRAERPLSTGRSVQGRQVDDETPVLAAPNGGVRFGVYTGPVTTQAASALVVSTAPVGAVGR
ncbi:hypothetical protein [Streptomyces olivaceoviridis]|uniref:hypothetical protein n=1 Tax=Streptomyces olivaceoviridis TaxID=1921 RepID=UPI0036F7B380